MVRCVKIQRAKIPHECCDNNLSSYFPLKFKMNERNKSQQAPRVQYSHRVRTPQERAQKHITRYFDEGKKCNKSTFVKRIFQKKYE